MKEKIKMTGLVKILIFAIAIYIIYAIFWDYINQLIAYAIKRINNLWCIAPIQVVILFLYTLALIIIRVILDNLYQD